MKITSYKNCVDGIHYIPNYLDNRDVAPDLVATEQMFVRVIPMDNKHATKYRGLTEFSQNDKTGGMKSNAEHISRTIFIKHVQFIGNCTLIDSESGKEVPCTCPAILFDEGPPSLVADIMKAIESESHLDKGKKPVSRP